MMPKYTNGVEIDMPKCPECGGHPVRIWMPFRNWDNGSKRKKPEMRVYLHCACGECTTDWHKTLEDARDAYLRKDWAVPFSKSKRA